MNSKYSIIYCDERSIMVVNPQGKLRQLYTPFRVVSIIPDGASKNTVYMVDEVKTTANNKLVYIINDRPFYHHNFAIIIGY